MSAWTNGVDGWIAVLIRIAAVIAVIGLSWNAVHIIIDAAVSGAGHTIGAVAYRIIGIVLGLILVASAPQIVSALQGLLRTPLAP